MTFASLEYIIFFPIVYFVYWVACRKNKNLQNLIIIIASLVFYGWWDWRFLGLLLTTATSTYLACLLMKKYTTCESRRKTISILCILLNVGILFYFKYFNFFIDSFYDAFSLFGNEISSSSLKIILPIGISFYTFSALSYSIDVYQRKIEATSDMLAYFAYIMFFPSILSGPISRAQNQLPQYFHVRLFDYQKAVNACKMILIGGIMKFCLADRIGIYVDAVYSNIMQHNGTTLLFTSILYSIQIYGDFAGYSLIAIGSGALLGIDLPTNFVRPYFAKTITEFWRRWHISLTTWFRDYIYFPLGGNRVSRSRWVTNTLIVFIVSGLWHGAAYTYIIWGALHGVFMIIERLIYKDKIKQIDTNLSVINVMRMLLTFTIVNFAWIFFRAESLNDAKLIVSKIFTDSSGIFLDVDTLAYSFIFLVVVFLIDFVEEFYKGKVLLMNSRHTLIRWTTYVISIVCIMLFGVLDGGSFIYFQF